MTTRAAALAGWLFVACAADLTAQTAPRIVAKTPGECTQTANAWRTAQLTAARTAMTEATTPEARNAAASKYAAAYGAVSHEAQRVAQECASGFSVEHVPSSQLIDLAALYAFVGDTANRRRATERALAATDLPRRQHAQAMVLAVSQEIARNASYFGILDGAERIVAQIDALPDSLADIKLGAHETMLGRYEYLDVDDGLRHHATVVLSLARKLNKPERMASAYLSFARSAADYLHPDSALAILDQGEKELGSNQTVERMFGDFRRRYALIGTRAATVTGDWWLNAPETPKVVEPGQGRVTVVEFTAHWCVPCKNSYPGMRALAERFRGKPFEGVLVTSLYGYLGDKKNLTPDEEVAADDVYFTREHALPYKVAINAPAKNERGQTTGQPRVDQDYRVGGIPQLVIIDKRGVIRQIVIGWDRGNTDRIGNLIELLLAEPVTR